MSTLSYQVSMGGAVVAQIGSGPHGDLDEATRARWGRVLTAIKGVVVVDVVGGTALEALPGMTKILSSRPHSFPSVPSAIQWTEASGLVKNLASAKVSVPPQITSRAPTADDPNEFTWRTDLLSSEPHWEG